jgi:tungstate transport system ATP-binding protein
MNEAILRADAISVRRGQFLLGPCDLALRSGEVLGIYGPNGSGKSTLLLALAGLMPLAEGRVVFRGQQVGQGLPQLEYSRRTAVVFQEPLLLRGTVWHNVTLGLRLRGVNGSEQIRRAQSWMQRLKIDHLAERSIGALSGGEAQRVSLARALVLKPEVLFLDEPFAGLDTASHARLLGELSDILKTTSGATVFVTHNLPEMASLCGRCVILDQGKDLQQGELAHIMREPRSTRVAEILGISGASGLALTMPHASAQPQVVLPTELIDEHRIQR